MAADYLLSARISKKEIAGAHGCIDAFEREFNYLCRTLRRLGTHRDDIEDLVHEVFLVLHRRWNDYDPSRPLKPWLFGIAFRVASAHRRRVAREVPHSSFEIEDLAPQQPEPVGAHEARAVVLGALAQIPLPRRAVIILYDLDEVPMRDVATALSIPLFTAYSRLRKARRELKAAVQSIQEQGRQP